MKLLKLYNSDNITTYVQVSDNLYKDFYTYLYDEHSTTIATKKHFEAFKKTKSKLYFFKEAIYNGE